MSNPYEGDRFDLTQPYVSQELFELRAKQRRLMLLVPPAFVKAIRDLGPQEGARTSDVMDGLLELRVRQWADALYGGESGLQELFNRYEETVLRNRIPEAVEAFLGQEKARFSGHRLQAMNELSNSRDEPYPKVGSSNLMSFFSAIEFADFLAGWPPV